MAETTCPRCGARTAGTREGDTEYCTSCGGVLVPAATARARALRAAAAEDDRRAGAEAGRQPSLAGYLACRAAHRRRLANDLDGGAGA